MTKKVKSLDQNPSVVFFRSGEKAKTGSVPLKVRQKQWSYWGEKWRKKELGGNIFSLHVGNQKAFDGGVLKNLSFGRELKKKSIKIPSFQVCYLQRVAFLSPLFVLYPDVRSPSVTLSAQWVHSLAVLPLYISFLKKQRPFEKQHKLSV